VVQREDTPNNIGYWTDADAWVEWSFKVDQPGEYEIVAELAVEEAGSHFRIELADQRKAVEVASTGSYSNYVELSLGQFSIDKAGECNLRIKPDADKWQPINLRRLELRRK
jgi:alpha-L-fucosidase